MKPRLRWRREPNERGLARVCQGWRGYELYRGEKRMATVAQANSGLTLRSFYWYGMGRNTLTEGKTFDSLDAAKENALAAARKAEEKS